MLIKFALTKILIRSQAFDDGTARTSALAIFPLYKKSLLPLLRLCSKLVLPDVVPLGPHLGGVSEIEFDIFRSDFPEKLIL